jgi:hypothetical protein
MMNRSDRRERMGEQTGPNHAGAERLGAELKRSGWTAAELTDRRDGDPQKVELARRLRAETTMTLAWIAEKLNMGAAGSLANLLRQSPREHKYVNMLDRPLYVWNSAGSKLATH